MRRASLICMLVAMLAVTAQARSLQQNIDLSKLDISKLPTLPALGLMPAGVQLPPLQEFLPPLDSINLPPLNEFLESVGLPSWEEMNLPPLSEFMKPVFDPKEVQLPSLADVLAQANATFVATLQDILKGVPLPPGAKLPELKLPPLPNVDLSRITVPQLDSSKLPPMPTLDQLITGLTALQNGDIGTLAKMVNVSMPTNLPPLSEVMKNLQPLAEVIQKMPQSLDLSQLSKIDLSKIDLSKIDFSKITDLSKIDIQGLLQGKVDLQSLAALSEVLKVLPAPSKDMALPKIDMKAANQVLKSANQVVKLFTNNNKNRGPASRHLLQVGFDFLSGSPDLDSFVPSRNFGANLPVGVKLPGGSATATAMSSNGVQQLQALMGIGNSVTNMLNPSDSGSSFDLNGFDIKPAGDGIGFDFDLVDPMFGPLHSSVPQQQQQQLESAPVSSSSSSTPRFAGQQPGSSSNNKSQHPKSATPAAAAAAIARGIPLPTAPSSTAVQQLQLQQQAAQLLQQRQQQYGPDLAAIQQYIQQQQQQQQQSNSDTAVLESGRQELVDVTPMHNPAAGMQPAQGVGSLTITATTAVQPAAAIRQVNPALQLVSVTPGTRYFDNNANPKPYPSTTAIDRSTLYSSSASASSSHESTSMHGGGATVPAVKHPAAAAKFGGMLRSAVQSVASAAAAAVAAGPAAALKSSTSTANQNLGRVAAVIT